MPTEITTVTVRVPWKLRLLQRRLQFEIDRRVFWGCRSSHPVAWLRDFAAIKSSLREIDADLERVISGFEEAQGRANDAY